MKFGPVAVAEAEGAILAHSTKAGGRTLKKGRVLDANDVTALFDSGIERVVAARLEPGEVGEDEAAATVAAALAGANVKIAEPFTGRVNLFATVRGLAQIDSARVDAVNLVDEAITVATLEPWTPVEPGQMLATIKIIPFAAPGRAVEACVAAGRGLVGVAPFRATDAFLIQTRLPGMKESILDKTVETTRQRLEQWGARLVGEARCAHEAPALAAEIAKAGTPGLLLVAGASAIVDRRDVIPAAIEAAGGRVEHFGMPVDPGQLLLLGRREGRPVLGLPGCARSPKENGFDWVLQRLLAGVEVSPRDIMRMGAGGLLAEIPSRPQPRGAERPSAPREPRIAAIVLAAGQSRRMGGPNKLLAPVEGKPMVRRSVESVLASGAAPVIVVLGHQRERVAAALEGLEVRLVENPDFATGLSTSLKRGLAEVPSSADAALICLGDMPFVTPAELGRLAAAFNPTEGRAIVVPTRAGKRGNPVLFARRFFAEMKEVAGDSGAKHLIGAYPEALAEVEMASDGVLTDIDTPESLARVTRRDRDALSQPGRAE
jgi:molybdenum cofactor cytidylyltransferase